MEAAARRPRKSPRWSGACAATFCVDLFNDRGGRCGTLSNHEVARGSTLLNITQQVSSSCGVALMSVLLTSHLNDSPVIPGTQHIPGLADGLTETQAAILSNTNPVEFADLGLDPAAVARGLVDAAAAFADTYWVAWVLVVLTLIPALLLPRKHEATHLLDDEDVPAPTREPGAEAESDQSTLKR